jgi:hypothetical protein
LIKLHPAWPSQKVRPVGKPTMGETVKHYSLWDISKCRSQTYFTIEIYIAP